MIKYSEDFYVDRLVKEWLKHEKLIIACDIDDTLLPFNQESKNICEQTIALLTDCQEEGIVLILNTARQKVLHPKSVIQIEHLGLEVTAINETPEELNLPYGKDGKVYANIFLDDRSCLPGSLITLRKSLEIVKEIRNQINLKENDEDENNL